MNQAEIADRKYGGLLLQQAEGLYGGILLGEYTSRIGNQ